VCVQRPVQDARHQGEDLLGVADRPEPQASARLGDRRPGTPIEPQPLDEQAGAGPSQRDHAVLDDALGRLVRPPLGRHVTEVFGRPGTRRDNVGDGGPQQTHTDVHTTVVDVEDVHQERCVVPDPTPPGNPGEQVVTVAESRRETVGNSVRRVHSADDLRYHLCHGGC